MHLFARNVNDAFRELVTVFSHAGYGSIVTKAKSRAGDVLMLNEPIIISYSHPLERVLFNEARDCNHFFHVVEALWMLAGRNDVATLEYYNSQIGKVASDDGKTFNGAYGYRWRHADVVDQLQLLIQHLKDKEGTRRAVLQMWNVEDDLLKIGVTKDVCCNLSVLFSIRDDSGGFVWGANAPADKVRGEPISPKKLDMTVFNRSNDLIWGCLGANYVHFSFLQEYVAAHLGVEVGVYNQVSNNLHVYTDKFKPEEWLKDITPDHYQDHQACQRKSIKLIQNPQAFDEQLGRFVDRWCGDLEASVIDSRYMDINEQFLKNVAFPLVAAFYMHKKREYKSALTYASECQSDDWRIAATTWLQRRQAGHNARQHIDNPYTKNELARMEGDPE